MRIVRGKAVNAAVEKLAARGVALSASVERQVRRIVNDVRANGDSALRRYAAQWDGLKAKQPLRVSDAELERAWQTAAPEFLRAIDAAAQNIRRFCEWQKPKDFLREIQPGVLVGQVVRPLASVGCYVPGGRYPLPSSLLMTVIPAQVAGVPRIAVVSPRPAQATLAAAAVLGVREFYRVGGAQAIAALAYGTRSVARGDKIVGPGNAFVTEAKRQVAFDCAIDFLAGPTEIAVVAHEGDATLIAADLVAQAEHDPQTSAVFVTSSASLAKEVAAEAQRQARGNAIAEVALQRNGMILLTDSREAALAAANRIAPEHLTVDRADVTGVTCAGSIFVGGFSPQAAGDYASGPNHVLPTGGVARFRGGLSVLDFVKIITVQELSRDGLRRIAPVVETLAATEGLEAHAASLRVRCVHA